MQRSAAASMHHPMGPKYNASGPERTLKEPKSKTGPGPATQKLAFHFSFPLHRHHVMLSSLSILLILRYILLY